MDNYEINAFYNEIYTLPNETYILPNDLYILPSDTYIFPNDTYILHSDTYTLPNDTYTLPSHTYSHYCSILMDLCRFVSFFWVFGGGLEGGWFCVNAAYGDADGSSFLLRCSVETASS